MTKILIENLTFAYQKNNPVLRRINLEISSGESVGIIGANGAGKSTLLKILIGLLPEYEGNVKIGENTVSKKNLGEIRRQAGYVFQDSESQLFLSTVYEDVAFGPKNYGYPKEEVQKRVFEALTKTGIENLAQRPIYSLSGGQKKLASIATILALTPEIILLDEPSIALDPKNRRNLIRVINEIEGTKVIASHDLDMVWDTCSRVVLLSENQIIRDGNAKEILSDQELLETHGLELPLSLQRKQEE